MPIDPSLTAQGFCQLLVKSRLVPADDVRVLYRTWRLESNTRDDDPDAFRKFLVARAAITDYQSQLLFRGNTEGYFLGPYTITDMIGKGHMAGVYRAVHQSGQVVAIKVLSASKARDPGILARFEREGRLLTSLDHPNIVRAFEVGSEDRKHYFVMEVLEGESLEAILNRRRRLSVPEAIGVASQILEGLAAIDSRSLIHRDIKPANLMLVPAPGGNLRETVLGATLKILDIGLGRETPDDRPTASTALTGENVLLGTPDYLAPEQARDARAADIRADLYSVGCVFYHMLTGQPPFPDTSLMNQMVRHAQEEPRPLKDLVAGIPDGLQRVLDFLLAKDPSRRYATPAKAIQGLQIYLDNVPKAAPRPAPLPEYIEWLSTSQPVAVVPVPAVAPPRPPSATLPRLPISETLDDVVLPPLPSFPRSPTAIAAPTGSKPYPALPAPTASVGNKPTPALPASALPPQAVALPPLDEDDDDGYDVEIVSPAPSARSVPFPSAVPFASAMPITSNLPVSVAVPVAVASKPEDDDDEEQERGLLDPNRRDFIMFGAGAASVLFAILTGYGLASLARDKPEPTEPAANPADEEEK